MKKMKMIQLTDDLSISVDIIEKIVKNLKQQGYIKEPNYTHTNFIDMLKVNVNNKKLTDKNFRKFVRNSVKVL